MASDLHIHTIYSDGSFTPEEVIRYAEKCGFSYLSITDHDILDGCEKAENIDSKVEVIPGVEIGCEGEGNIEEIHILGYLIDIENQKLKDFLAPIREGRERRVRKIVKRLQERGINIDYEEVKKIGGPGAIGRLHIARVLFDKGLASLVLSCFDKYLSFGKYGFAERENLPKPERAIEIIRLAGGIPVLAHPYDTIKLLPSLVKFGLMGIEVIHPRIDPNLSTFLRRKASEYGILTTGGSDCHGKLKQEEILLGKWTIDDSEVKRLLLRGFI
ncbi:MAG: PHP domain-containing protein [bacterium]